MRHSFSRSFAVILLLILFSIFLSRFVSAAQIKLAWDPPDGGGSYTGYRVYYGTASWTFGPPTYVGNVQTHTLTGLTEGQSYFIAVTSFNNITSKESVYSNQAIGVAGNPYTVATNPTGLQVTVDGVNYTAPRTFDWVVGSSHTLSVSSPQSGGSGVRYVYGSWSDGLGQSHGITVPSSNTTYTASFATQYSLTTSVSPSGGGNVSPSGANWYGSGQSVSVSASPSTGYSFSYWLGDLTGSANPASLSMSGPRSVTANFTQDQYSLTVAVSPSGVGSVTKSPNKATYVYGEQVQLTATANPGYTFSGWSAGASGTTNPLVITMNGNKTVTANFTQVNYTLSLSKTGNGSVKVNGALHSLPWSGQFSSGAQVQLEAIPGTGWSFSNWSVDLTGSTNPATISMNANRSVTALFTLGTPLNDTTEFVKQQYRDFLKREADAGGLQYWVNMIDTGGITEAEVIEEFVWSPEFGVRIAPLVRLYFAYFLRIPDYGGLQFWLGAYSSGEWSLGAISDYFASSPEFQQRYGSLSNQEFVTLIYQNILGRDPDPGGFAFWVGELNLQNRTRGQVMIGFSESVEYQEDSRNGVFVTMIYVGMLRRSPEEGEFDNYLDSGNSDLALINELLYSQEYMSRFQ